jgi:ubiquinone/menaquinone biosynthesis C-methylase UbiE
MSDIEKTVRDFYDNFGWQKFGDTSGEDNLFRRFSRQYYDYHDLVNQRTLNCFSGITDKLLIAGGGDLPETHTKIAQQFSSVCCLDISQKSLDISKQKLSDKGEYLLGSILDIPKPAEHFGAIYCAHVIYHIDKELQSKAIRELLRVIRPGGKAVIIYSNPDSIAGSMARMLSKIAVDLASTKSQISNRNKCSPALFLCAPFAMVESVQRCM